jgi:hypothetical protein
MAAQYIMEGARDRGSTQLMVAKKLKEREIGRTSTAFKDTPSIT